MVFAGALGDELDEVLLAFRKNGLTGIGLKAVLTASNKSWTSLQLYEELKRERAAMKRRMDEKLHCKGQKSRN